MSGSSTSRWAGGLMGLVAGSFVAIFAVGGVAGFLWLYVFGDNPWPPWAGWILAGAAVAVVLVGVAAGVKFGERLKASVAWALAAIVLLVAASAISVKVSRDLALSARKQKEDATLATLTRNCHRMSAVRPVSRADKSGWDVAIGFGGPRTGPYRLRMALRRGGRVILSRESQIDLRYGESEQNFPLELSEVIAAYEGRVFTKDARNLAIEEAVELECTLEPILTPEEVFVLSSSDVQNLRLGQSPLIDKKKAALRVEFVVR